LLLALALLSVLVVSLALTSLACRPIIVGS
jgi:hypothetical protein